MRRRISQPSSPSPALARLGLATPPPFVGRDSELMELCRALAGSPILVVNGAVGAGKTRLAGELGRQEGLRGGLQVTRVACAPGDLGVAVVARCERAMDRMPGSLSAVLHKEERLLIIDDVHHLPPVDVARLVRGVVDRPGVGRLLLLTRDILPLPRNDARHFSLSLEGLSETSARDLWAHLEDLYGPTSQGACDQALTKTRGMPLAMRREYARSRYGKDAWELEGLSTDARSALEAVCVARLPAAPAAVAALLEVANVEGSLIDLVSRQLIDPLESGRFAVHDVVRDQVLETIPETRRGQLEMRAAELVRGMGRGVSAVRPAWTAGDDGAIALLDPVDRSREILMHLIAAGQFELAAEELSSTARGALARGAGGELLAQIEKLRAHGQTSAALTKVEALVAIGHGRVADAISLGAELDAPVQAYLRFRAGEVRVARESLHLICGAESADTAALAAALLSEVELACGKVDLAEEVLSRAFDSRAQLSGASLAYLHLAFAQVESHRGNLSGARAALARATGCADGGELAARVEVQRVQNLVSEGRFGEARALRPQVECAVAEVDCVPLGDELARCEALVNFRSGDTEQALESLRNVIAAARRRGDEIGALRADLELADMLVELGQLRAAAELIMAVSSAASRYGLDAMAAWAELLLARVGLCEMRDDVAAEQLSLVDQQLLSSSQRASAGALERSLRACRGGKNSAEACSTLEAAQLALASGDGALALKNARKAAIDADRLGYRANLGKALAIVARMELARGDRKAALAAASRAARESLHSASIESRIQALLVLSALARDGEQLREASVYARDAKTLATDNGLVVQQMIAAQALEVIAHDDSDSRKPLPTASAATASERAVAAAECMLSDLGFSTARPFRCVDALGAESFVASASPDLLGMNERSLVVDAVRQVIVRDGEPVADLRRRSLLKRLLFLFAARPHHVFSKEEIVEQVWEVEYHPLRHDAALFTNIMRIRRLLGDDGIDLVQASEAGYSLVPPKDFLYVEHTTR